MKHFLIVLLSISTLIVSCNDGLDDTTVRTEQELISEITAAPEFIRLMNTFSHEGKNADTRSETTHGQQRENEKRVLVAYGEILSQYRDELAKSEDELSYTTTFKKIILASNYDDLTKQEMIKRVEDTSKTLKEKEDLMHTLTKKYPEVKDKALLEKLFSYYRNSKKY